MISTAKKQNSWLRRLWCGLGFHYAAVVYFGDDGTAWTCQHCGRESPDLRRAQKGQRS